MEKGRGRKQCEFGVRVRRSRETDVARELEDIGKPEVQISVANPKNGVRAGNGVAGSVWARAMVWRNRCGQGYRWAYVAN